MQLHGLGFSRRDFQPFKRVEILNVTIAACFPPAEAGTPNFGPDPTVNERKILFRFAYIKIMEFTIDYYE